MLMHQGIGLDGFNALPRTRAVHALFECCCSVMWAQKMADARPFASRADLVARADLELLALSPQDLDRAFATRSRTKAEIQYTVPELARISHVRIERMLGPEGGWPAY